MRTVHRHHVLGANASSRPGWSGAYQHTDSFYEPITFYSYVAGISPHIELATGVIILPQRQTALFAKQSATLEKSHYLLFYLKLTTLKN